MKYSRRSFLTHASLGLASSAFFVRPADADPGEVKPNILIVLTDDQGWGDVRSHGNERIETPNMDALAASGARFDRFYVSPVCAPTRASLLTGRYSMRTGVSGVTHRKEVMRNEEVTLAEVLRESGYATGCFGKWHNGVHYPYHPNGQGFDEFFGFCAGHWNNYFDTTLEHNGRPVKTKGYITDVITDAAIGFMQQNRTRPFFCYVPYNTPHAPFQVPDAYFDAYKARGLDDTLASVYGMCKNIDDNLGRMLAKLEEWDLANDTIVLFFGDNGPNTERYNGGMLGRKGSVHEGGVRNSLFMRYPRRVKPGTEVKQIAAHIDLLPTLADLAGVSMPKTLPLDGVSLVPLLDGNASHWPERVLFSYWGVRGAVRTQRYRLVVEKAKVALYDMDSDPGQQNDIAAELPEVVGELKALYDAWFAEVTKNGLEPPPAPIGYREMPVVELPAPEAILEGGVKFKGDKGWANDWITNWTSTDGVVSWSVDVVRQGAYEVTLMYTCPEQDVGATVCVEIAGQRLEGVVAKAHDPEPLPSPDRVPRGEVFEKEWAPLTLGSVQLPEGPGEIRVRALTKPGNSVMDLKAVRVSLVGVQ